MLIGDKMRLERETIEMVFKPIGKQGVQEIGGRPRKMLDKEVRYGLTILSSVKKKIQVTRNKQQGFQIHFC